MPVSTEQHDLCVQALIILLLPLAAFVVQIFFSKKIPPRNRQGDWLPTFAMLIALVLASKMFVVDLIGNEGGIEAQRWYPFQTTAEQADANAWILIPGAEGAGVSSGAGGAEGTEGAGFRMDFGILVDNLTITMLFVVCLVSFLVHLYSIGYMHGEVRYGRFFAFLALFSFSMLGLCITSNLLFLFIFWELVGLCSYFLIGFYFEKKSASNAAMKAFITTRIGDLGFFAAIMIIAATVGSLEFDAIFDSLKGPDSVWLAGGLAVGLTTAGICLFIGPIGKSAQFPMHVWLPDAMEGPTPVSALIHAATMVVAGVYLVARMFPFMAGTGYFEGDYFSSAPLYIVALVGGDPRRALQRDERHGWLAQEDAHHLGHFPDQYARDCGAAASFGILLQGSDPDAGDGLRTSPSRDNELAAVYLWHSDGGNDGLLYVPNVLPHLPRRAKEPEGLRSRARVTLDHDGASGASRLSFRCDRWTHGVFAQLVSRSSI